MSRKPQRRLRLPCGRFVDARPRPPSQAALPHPHTQRSDRHEAQGRQPLPVQPSRVIGRVEPGTVVTLLGAGSVGSHAGQLLAQMGCSLIAIDKDEVEPSNIKAGRTAYTQQMIGIPKVMALAQTIKQMGLSVKVAPLYRGLETFSDDEIRSLAQRSAAVVAAFDDAGQLVRVSGLVYPLCRSVHPGFHRGGRSGHVIWTRPGTPCFCCALGISSAADIHTLHAEPALPLDIQRISQMTARVTLWLCSPPAGDAASLLDPSCSIIFLDNRPSEGVERALSAELLEADSDPSCPVCGPFAHPERR